MTGQILLEKEIELLHEKRIGVPIPEIVLVVFKLGLEVAENSQR